MKASACEPSVTQSPRFGRSACPPHDLVVAMMRSRRLRASNSSRRPAVGFDRSIPSRMSVMGVSRGARRAHSASKAPDGSSAGSVPAREHTTPPITRVQYWSSSSTAVGGSMNATMDPDAWFVAAHVRTSVDFPENRLPWISTDEVGFDNTSNNWRRTTGCVFGTGSTFPPIIESIPSRPSPPDTLRYLGAVFPRLIFFTDCLWFIECFFARFSIRYRHCRFESLATSSWIRSSQHRAQRGVDPQQWRQDRRELIRGDPPWARHRSGGVGLSATALGCRFGSERCDAGRERYGRVPVRRPRRAPRKAPRTFLNRRGGVVSREALARACAPPRLMSRSCCSSHTTVRLRRLIGLWTNGAAADETTVSFVSSRRAVETTSAGSRPQTPEEHSSTTVDSCSK